MVEPFVAETEHAHPEEVAQSPLVSGYPSFHTYNSFPVFVEDVQMSDIKEAETQDSYQSLKILTSTKKKDQLSLSILFWNHCDAIPFGFNEIMPENETIF